MNAPMESTLAEVIGIDRQEKALRKRALDDLVDLIMDGQGFPKHGRNQISLHGILCECDQSDLADAVCLELARGFELESRISNIVRAYLNESTWHEQYIEKLIEDERDEAQG